MNPLPKISLLLVAASALLLFTLPARAQSLSATWNAVTDIPETTGSGWTATGNPVTFTLNVTPPTGTTLTVISNTGSAYITGTFNNLAQGQVVPLTYNGITFNFAANYFGGAGKDLTLQWANNFAFAWGSNTTGQLGDSGTANSLTPVQVTSTGVLAGKTIGQLSAGQGFSAALTVDGGIATWGDNSLGQLGDGGAETSSTAPVLVDSSTDSAINGRTVIAISAGANHALSLTSDGAVEAWGDNSFGQLGNSGSTGSLVPVLVDTSTDSALNGKTVTAISAGSNHSLALSSDGSIEAWGNNASGQLGDNGAETSSTTPVLVDSSSGSALFGKTVTAVSGGANHSLALLSNGSVAAWGSNASGQLGNSGSANSLIPVAVSTSTNSALNGKTVVAVSAGANHSLALCSDGTIVAWGDNSAGELGNGGTNSSLVPVKVNQTTALSGKTVTAIAAGNNFSLALCSDGSVAAWGDNSFGELGISGTQAQAFATMPVAVDAASFPIAPSVNAPVIAIAAGPQAQTSLAIVAEQGPPVIEVQQPAGTNLVSGSSSVDFGSLVLGTTNQITYTVVNEGQAPLANLAAAFSGSDASAFTSGSFGATTLDSGGSTTVTVTFLPTMSGTQAATFAITSNDPVTPSFDTAVTGTGLAIDGTFTSGTQPLISANNYYPSGIPINPALGFAPPVGTSLTIVSNTGSALISGTFSNLAQGQLVALTFNGVTYDFIANYFGGTGNDLVLDWAATSPVAWGLNGNGQLGTDGTANSPTPVAVDVTAPSSLASGTVTEFAAGSTYSLALTSDGSISAWGDNSYGELGTGGTSGSLFPVAVDSSTDSALNGKTVVSITAGSIHNLALCSDGSLAAWGYGGDGELGTGGTMGSFVPVAVDTSTNSALNGRTVKAISAGDFHNLTLCTDGSVIAWGYNIAGQLGTGGTGNSPDPVVVSSASGTALFGKTVVSVAAGRDFSLALCSDGSVAAWGDNSTGQLGYTGSASTLRPVAVDSSSSSALFGKTVVAIAAGGYHSLALCSDGTVVTWGYNGIGELGDGAMVSSTRPVAVSTAGALGGKTVTAIAAGLFHSLAYCSDGSVAAWGWDQNGQLGDGGVFPYSATPVGVDTSGFGAGTAFYSVFTGPAASHSLALTAAAANGQLLTFTVTPSITGTDGTLTPDTPQTVSSGASVMFTATSGSGYAVSQWLVNGQVVQTIGNTYTLSDVTTNTSVVVSFAPMQKPSAANAGVYEGLFLDGSGLINLNLSANGKFSGKVTIDGTAHSVSGHFNASGQASVGTLNLQLAGGVGGSLGSYFINGSYNGDPLTAWHAAYSKTSNDLEAGTYTFQVAAVSRDQTHVPQTKSTLTLVISKTGAVKLSGKLPDGQSVNTTSTITGGPSGNQFFIYDTLAYKNVATPGQRGFLTGDLATTSGAINGPLLWTKPSQTSGTWQAAFKTGLIITQ